MKLLAVAAIVVIGLVHLSEQCCFPNKFTVDFHYSKTLIKEGTITADYQQQKFYIKYTQPLYPTNYEFIDLNQRKRYSFFRNGHCYIQGTSDQVITKQCPGGTGKSFPVGLSHRFNMMSWTYNLDKDNVVTMVTTPDCFPVMSEATGRTYRAQRIYVNAKSTIDSNLFKNVDTSSCTLLG